MRTGLKSGSGKNRDWVLGEWRHEDDISICNQGFHASKTPLQALGYVAGEVLAMVEVKDESIKQEDKECWSDMRIVKAYHWTKKDSVALSVFAAELVIKNYEKKYPNDTRPRDAIEAAKKVLADDTEKNRSAARSAVRSAAESAWSAAESARSAVRSARSAAESVAESAESAAESARSATRSAVRSARSAAESAAESARSAVRSARSAAAKKKLVASLDKWFLARIKTLEEIK